MITVGDLGEVSGPRRGDIRRIRRNNRPGMSSRAGSVRRSGEMFPKNGETVKYMLLICVGDEVDVPPDTPNIEQWLEKVGSRRLHGSEMRPISDATTVRTRGGDVLLSSGPFAETAEHIAGYDLIECADLDEATEIAAAHPVAHFGSVEVRPLHE